MHVGNDTFSEPHQHLPLVGQRILITRYARTKAEERSDKTRCQKISKEAIPGLSKHKHHTNAKITPFEGICSMSLFSTTKYAAVWYRIPKIACCIKVLSRYFAVTPQSERM